MTKWHSARWTRIAALVIALLAATSSAWSDSRFSVGGNETKKLCYCGCDSKPGTMMCMHMCELPKYKNRWWANFCHKVQEKLLPSQPSNQGEGSTSRKNNRVQEARL